MNTFRCDYCYCHKPKSEIQMINLANAILDYCEAYYNNCGHGCEVVTCSACGRHIPACHSPELDEPDVYLCCV